MQKSTYLIINGLLSFGYIPTRIIPLTPDMLLVLQLFWIGFGLFYYKGYAPTFNWKNQAFVLAVFVLLFLSMLSPVFRYNQPFIPTAIAMRGNLVFLYLLALMKIGPTEEEFEYSFKVLGIMALVLCVVVYAFPTLYAEDRAIQGLLLRQRQGSTDIIASFPGNLAARIYFYILLGKLVKEHTIRIFLWCTLFMGYILLLQNRSTLLCALPFYLYAVWKAEVRFKTWILAAILLIGGTSIIWILSSLLEETQSQLGDAKYNRWQAVQFFLFEYKYTFYSFFFGNGTSCAGSYFLRYLQAIMHSRLAILSDIGLLGNFFMYGIIMMGYVYYYIIRGAFVRYMPLFLKLSCWFVILVPTIHHFPSISMVYVIYFVMYYTEVYKQSLNKENNLLR